MSTYRIGIVSSYFPFEPATEGQSPIRAAINSAESTYLILEGSIKGLYHIVFGNISSCNLSGPLSIAETSGQMVKQKFKLSLVYSCFIGCNRNDKLISDTGTGRWTLNVFAFEALLEKAQSCSGKWIYDIRFL